MNKTCKVCDAKSLFKQLNNNGDSDNNDYYDDQENSIHLSITVLKPEWIKPVTRTTQNHYIDKLNRYHSGCQIVK